MSTDSVLLLLLNIVSVVPSETGSIFSLAGEGTRPILTGSEEPSNQDAMLLETPPDLDLAAFSLSCNSYSAASAGEIRSGDAVLLRVGDLREGRKFERREGDEEEMRVECGGRSDAGRTLERSQSVVEAGGGSVMVGPFSSTGRCCFAKGICVVDRRYEMVLPAGSRSEPLILTAVYGWEARSRPMF